MSAAYTPAMGDRITELLTMWKLTAAAGELVPRLAAAGHDAALALVADVFELEAQTRGERRVDRLRKASKLPPAKTFDSLDRARVPRPALIKAQELARGGFLDRGGNVLLFGLPGVGKSHLACAVGHALVDAGRSVFFTPTYQLVQVLLAARRPSRCRTHCELSTSSTPSSSTTSTTCSRPPKRPKCSSRSWPNATSAAR